MSRSSLYGTDWPFVWMLTVFALLATFGLSALVYGAAVAPAVPAMLGLAAFAFIVFVMLVGIVIMLIKELT